MGDSVYHLGLPKQDCSPSGECVAGVMVRRKPLIINAHPSLLAFSCQFEWAWQKPHLSRHLRTHSSIDAVPSSSQHIPLPLFTDTPLNQVPIGEDGCKALSTSSVQSSLLVARALLRSEPFSTWNLRITFFEEYCWAAWLRLEQDLCRKFSRSVAEQEYRKVGLRSKRSRLGRPLPPPHLSPAPICDFAGVDGAKKSMLALNEQEKSAMKLEAKASKAVQEGRSPGQWPEKLPKNLTVRAMGGTWDMLRQAPAAPNPILNSTKKGAAGEGRCEMPRMRLNDEDQAELSWQRYRRFLDSKGLSLESVQPSSPGAPAQQCALCKSDVFLQQQLTYACCPSPFSQLHPSSRPEGSSRSLSRYGFHRDGESSAKYAGPSEQSSSCLSVFHLACLASHFTSRQQRGEAAYLLPTHGSCPSCGAEDREVDCNTWTEVVRSMYRRKERLEKEIAREEAIRAREERLRMKSTTKKRSTANASSKGHARTEDDGVEVGDDGGEERPCAPKRAGLLVALDDIQSKPRGKRGFRPASTLLRDPVQPASKPSMTPPAVPVSAPAVKRSSLLCNLDSLLNTPSQPKPSQVEAKRAKSTARRPSPSEEVIDLT